MADGNQNQEAFFEKNTFLQNNNNKNILEAVVPAISG